MIRVLVVDDSALMRKMIPQILMADPEIEVAGTAMDGDFALNKIEKLRPDVITLDVSMPRMGGLEALEVIMERYGTPTVIVSSLARKDAEVTLRALEMGAFDFVMKPQDAISVHIADIGIELIRKVKAAHEFRKTTVPVKKPKEPAAPKEKGPGLDTKHLRYANKVLAVGISTGGPNALSQLLPLIPKEFPAAILIVQHMPHGFTEMFANRLNYLCEIEVKEARDGDVVVPGRALIAPGNRHMKVKRLPLAAIAVLSDLPPVNGLKPSADVLFRSVAGEFGSNATGLIMTGMGNDGADGIGAIRERGGMTIAQDKESCVVFGMPKAAVEMGNISKTVSLGKMADFLIDHFQKMEVAYGTGVS